MRPKHDRNPQWNDWFVRTGSENFRSAVLSDDLEKYPFPKGIGVGLGKLFITLLCGIALLPAAATGNLGSTHVNSLTGETHRYSNRRGRGRTRKET